MEFGYTTLALRSMFGTNNGIAGQVLVGFGTEEQKKQWLEGIASGEIVASFALTEPGAGSNPAGLRTRASRDGEDWVLDGQKRFGTNAPLADLFVVFARTPVAYAAANTQGGVPIGARQLVQAMLADQYTGVSAGRALVRDTAAAYDSGIDRRIGPSAAKLFCTEMAGRVADLAVQIHGGTGYMREVPVERIYREVRLLRLYEGTSEIQRLIVGGALVR